jgi:hypothetical protein
MQATLEEMLEVVFSTVQYPNLESYQECRKSDPLKA